MAKLGSTAAGDGVAVGLFDHVDADNTLDFFNDSYINPTPRIIHKTPNWTV